MSVLFPLTDTDTRNPPIVRIIFSEPCQSARDRILEGVRRWNPQCDIEWVPSSDLLLRRVQAQTYDLAILRHTANTQAIRDLRRIPGAPAGAMILAEEDGPQALVDLTRQGAHHLITHEEASSPSSLSDVLDRLFREIHREERVRLEGSQQSLAVLAGGMAHDINNMLAVIMGNTSLLADSQAEETEEAYLCDSILSAADKLAELGRKLLAFSQGDRFLPQDILLDEIVGESLNGIMRSQPEVNIEPVLADDLAIMDGDLAQLQQMLSVLFQNALEAMPSGGRLRVSVENGSRPSDDGATFLPTVQLRISDTGIGMTPEQCHRALEPFYSTKAAGRGLGLTIAAGIVRNHGGHISIESQRGRGTSVLVTLPTREDVAKRLVKPPTPRLSPHREIQEPISKWAAS